MREYLWRLAARQLARPWIADWLIRRALRTPYTPIIKEGKLYMGRYWLFNPYHKRSWWRSRLPSARLHIIHLPDQDRHLHSHPWDARTIILRNGYTEERLTGVDKVGDITWHYPRFAGDTAALKPDDYHRITTLHNGPAYTLFITWKYVAKWGFRVNGRHIYWRDYLGVKK